jgi:diphthamide biosynthesis protein 2
MLDLFADRQIYAYTDSSVIPLHPRTSRLLQKRLFALHSAMASDVFGLVVGNVGLASSKDLLDQLRKQLKKASKKSYTLSVGRLNPAKLANFAEIECFVLVGCAEGGVVDSKDFLRPIITPWEMLLALKGPENDWKPEQWTLDLSRVLDGTSPVWEFANDIRSSSEGCRRDCKYQGRI